jgi:hypothetical protein
MKRKRVEDTTYYKGKYVVSLSLIEEIAAILHEAFSSCGIEVDDYELENLGEIPRLKQKDASRILLAGPRKFEDYYRSGGVSVRIDTTFLAISITDKYDYRCLGVKTRLEKLIEKARLPDESQKSYGGTECRIELTPVSVAPIPLTALGQTGGSTPGVATIDHNLLALQETTVSSVPVQGTAPGGVTFFL